MLCRFGRVDLLTDREVVEIKSMSRWKHALGQVLVYSDCFLGHSPRIHLFTEGSLLAIDVASIRDACIRYNVRVTIEP